MPKRYALYCPKCGTENVHGGSLCHHCGADLPAEVESAPALSTHTSPVQPVTPPKRSYDYVIILAAVATALLATVVLVYLIGRPLATLISVITPTSIPVPNAGPEFALNPTATERPTSSPMPTPTLPPPTPTVPTPTVPPVVTKAAILPSRTPTLTAVPITQTSVTSITNFVITNISDSEISVTIDYSYNGDHGASVWLDAEATGSGSGLCLRGGIPITPGSGTVTIPIKCSAALCKACDGWATDRVWVGMAENFSTSQAPENFNSTSASYVKTWAQSR